MGKHLKRPKSKNSIPEKSNRASQVKKKHTAKTKDIPSLQVKYIDRS
jgi:hypothetical protein